MELKDSGQRRTFNTGAVRDIAEHKGRCDLLPLSEIAELTGIHELYYIDAFVREGTVSSLRVAIEQFITNNYTDKHTAMLELAKHYELGAEKYAERNWEQGIPIHCYVDSGIRHLLKHYRGDTDEPHANAFLWNMFSLLWTLHNVVEPSPLFDLPFGTSVYAGNAEGAEAVHD